MSNQENLMQKFKEQYEAIRETEREYSYNAFWDKVELLKDANEQLDDFDSFVKKYINIKKSQAYNYIKVYDLFFNRICKDKQNLDSPVDWKTMLFEYGVTISAALNNLENDKLIIEYIVTLGESKLKERLLIEAIELVNSGVDAVEAVEQMREKARAELKGAEKWKQKEAAYKARITELEELLARKDEELGLVPRSTLSVAEFSQITGDTQDAVYKQIQREKLDVKKVNGKNEVVLASVANDKKKKIMLHFENQNKTVEEQYPEAQRTKARAKRDITLKYLELKKKQNQRR
jgi:hypothetical protein